MTRSIFHEIFITLVKSNEVFLNLANYGNKRRNLMQTKILYCEVHLPLHEWYPMLQLTKNGVG